MSTTLTALKLVLCGKSPGDQGILQDESYYSAIATNINDAVTAIAGGILMPKGTVNEGQFSPPLPELYDSDTVATDTENPFKALPSDYQRGLFMVVDNTGNQVYPPAGGDYYSFALFLKQATKKDLTQAGSISSVCVKGTNLYYQGIPTSSKDLTVHFYRAPEDMSDGDDEPDGLPGHLQTRLIKHWVCKEIFGEGLEDSDESRGAAVAYHTRKFYEAMSDLIDSIGIDETAQYYGVGEFQDLGVCD